MVSWNRSRVRLTTEAAAAARVIDRAPPREDRASIGYPHRLPTLMPGSVPGAPRSPCLPAAVGTPHPGQYGPQSRSLEMAEATSAAGELLPVIRFNNFRHAALASLYLGLSFTWLPYPLVVLPR